MGADPPFNLSCKGLHPPFACREQNDSASIAGASSTDIDQAAHCQPEPSLSAGLDGIKRPLWSNQTDQQLDKRLVQ